MTPLHIVLCNHPRSPTLLIILGWIISSKCVVVIAFDWSSLQKNYTWSVQTVHIKWVESRSKVTRRVSVVKAFSLLVYCVSIALAAVEGQVPSEGLGPNASSQKVTFTTQKIDTNSSTMAPTINLKEKVGERDGWIASFWKKKLQ